MTVGVIKLKGKQKNNVDKIVEIVVEPRQLHAQNVLNKWKTWAEDLVGGALVY